MEINATADVTLTVHLTYAESQSKLFLKFHLYDNGVTQELGSNFDQAVLVMISSRLAAGSIWTSHSATLPKSPALLTC
jgi:hypothetical protein